MKACHISRFSALLNLVPVTKKKQKRCADFLFVIYVCSFYKENVVLKPSPVNASSTPAASFSGSGRGEQRYFKARKLHEM